MLLRIIWQLPQYVVSTILYIFLFPFLKFERRIGDVVVFRFKIKSPGSLQLGWLILLDRDADLRTLKHEYGHHVQSLLIGPFMLFVIALPSLAWVIFYKITRAMFKHTWDYDSPIFEHTASTLGAIYLP